MVYKLIHTERYTEMQVTKELLFEYFSGRLTALQRNQIAQWAKDPQHEEWFYQCLDEWERSSLQYSAEVEGSLENYRRFLHHASVGPVTTPVPGRHAAPSRPGHTIPRGPAR